MSGALVMSSVTPLVSSDIASSMNQRTSLMTGSISSALAEGLLKDVYLPGLTDTIYSNDSLARFIERNSRKVRFAGNRLIHTFKTKRAGNVGAIKEGGSFVTGSAMAGQQVWESIKILNMFVDATNFALATSQGDDASFVNLMNEMFKDVYTNARNYTERVLAGRGDGIIGYTADTADIADDATSTTFTITGGGGFFPVQFFWPGQRVDLWWNPSTGTAFSTATCPGTYARNCVVTAVDPANDTITVTHGDTGGVTNKTIWFTTAGAYSAYTAGATCLEPNGLFNLVATGDSTANKDIVWNIVDGSSYRPSFLRSLVYNANGAELTEALLLTQMTVLEYQYQANPNILITTPRSVNTYFQNAVHGGGTGDLRRFGGVFPAQWTGGFTSLAMQVGNKTLGLTAMASLPTGSLLMLNTNDFAFASATNGFQWLGNGEAMIQSHSTDTKFATAVDYMNFLCFDPARQYRMYGLDESWDGTPGA